MKALILASGLLWVPPVERPPTWYQHSPSQEVRIRFVQPERVHQACVTAGVTPKEGYVIIACSLPGGRLIMPNPCRFGDGYAQLACHEASHVNGWRHE